MYKLVLNNRNEEHISFVLSDDEGRIIAVIVPKHEVDCLGLVAQAIMEEFCDTEQVKFNEIKLDNEDFITSVKLEVTMLEDGEEEFIRNFELTKTALYHD